MNFNPLVYLNNNFQNDNNISPTKSDSNKNLNNSSNNNSNSKSDNYDINENLNINQLLNDGFKSSNAKKSSSKTKAFNIQENNLYIYIENVIQCCTIKIHKSLHVKMCIVDNENELINLKSGNTVQADAIIGIFDLNTNKYLGIVTSSAKVANLMDANIYKINTIDLIKITYNQESMSDKALIASIKNFFNSGNFYYSNEYDISLSLYNQSKINKQENNKNIILSKYSINFSLLKYFKENNIPDFFYCAIIFGYVGCQNQIVLNDSMTLDIFFIERYFKKHLLINNSILGYIKQIEIIFVFKDKYKKNLDNIFSYVLYISSESFKFINKFLPFKNNLLEEFYLYKNIICIINSLNKDFNNMKLNDVISKFNKSLLNNKITAISFTSDWNKNYSMFDTLYDSNRYIDFYYNDSEDIIQDNVFWFIDINNTFFHDNVCINTIQRIIWKVLQKEINFIGLNMNLGSYEKNKSIIFTKIIELMLIYQNDLIDLKKVLLLKHCAKNQEIIDKYFCSHNINNYEENNFEYLKKEKNIKENKIEENNKDNILKKLKILCTTWNIAGISPSNYNISELFSHNVFYNENKSPDIIVVSIQEIVKLNLKNILSINSNQENVNFWKKLIKKTLKTVYSKETYLEIKCLDLVGIFIIVLIKDEIKNNVFLLDHNITKRGMYGTLGNKGFFTVSMQCYDKIICIGSGHFEAGKGKNDERINTLIQILNKPINIQEDEIINFKDVDYWIIMGDLNFRIEVSYEDAISFIQEKNYADLYNMDQFNLARENNNILKKYINEKRINFDPTYKYEIESNEYAYDEDKIRVPAWTDRIFFCNHTGIKMLTYDCIKNLRYSDHRPVVGAFEIDVYLNKKRNLKKNIKNTNNFNDTKNNSQSNKIELIDMDEHNQNLKNNDTQEKNVNQIFTNPNNDSKNSNFDNKNINNNFLNINNFNNNKNAMNQINNLNDIFLNQNNMNFNNQNNNMNFNNQNNNININNQINNINLNNQNNNINFSNINSNNFNNNINNFKNESNFNNFNSNYQMNNMNNFNFQNINFPYNM